MVLNNLFDNDDFNPCISFVSHQGHSFMMERPFVQVVSCVGVNSKDDKFSFVALGGILSFSMNLGE